MVSRETNKTSFIPGIEGLRTLSVLGVILFHLWPKIFAGGFSGVTVFFVVSGFLMTSIVLKDLAAFGHLRLKRFYLRRFWRLYPAFIVMIFLTTALLFFFFPAGLFGIRGTLISNLFYVNNWYQILHQVSYFAAGAHWSVFTHLWSLSVEAQFYVIWPLLVTAILYLADKKWQLSLLIPAILALISSFLLAILYSPVSTNRAYYGTDSRVFSFIIGGMVAILITLLRSQACPKILRRFQQLLAEYSVWIISASFSGALILFVIANGVQAWVYDFGMLLLSIFTALLIYYFVMVPENHFNLIMGNHFFRYIGSRSYSIYLYQLPVFVILEEIFRNFSPLVHFWVSLFSILLIMLLADLSYRWVEMPFRHGMIHMTRQSFMSVKTVLTSLLIVLTLTGTFLGFISKDATRSKSADQLRRHLQSESQKISRQNSQAVSARQNAVSSQSAKSSQSSAASGADQQLAGIFQTSPENIAKVRQLSVTAIGDSVLLDVGPDLQMAMPKAIVNARIGRHTQEAIDSLQALKDEKKLDPIILMVIGTNGEISADNIQQVRRIAGNRQVFWVNSFSGGKPWEGPNNNLLSSFDKQDSNLHVIDWYSGAHAHPEWFEPDGVHPQRAGNRAMTTMIINSIASGVK
ncbi:MAG: acyltransferase family protein [Oenococcus sp.]|uniref:acyltransferase family protein n=1 Tax=Oenococcus sp. TaxID=1979414 RepID=UPI0039E9BBD1